MQSHPPQPAIPRHPLVSDNSDGDITITHAPRLTTGRSTSLQDRLLAAKERNTSLQPAKGAPRDPLDKYIKGNMPKVHVADSTATLNFIDIDLVIEWENYDRGKLIAIPFSIEADKIENHVTIGEHLLTAATEITQAENLGISTPTPSDDATRYGHIPTSFLIYNLSDDNINTLMQRGIWSSQAITFRVTELHPPRPDFLFTIRGLTTRDDDSILDMVKIAWEGNTIQNIIEDIVKSFDEDCQTIIRTNIHQFLCSIQVKRLDFKTKGKVEAPRFNIYADGQFILDDNDWFHLRESLANLPYASPMQGRATTELSPATCSICHGVDHPTGMCDFQKMDDWNGPTSDSIAMNSPQFGDRNRCGPCTNRNFRF